VQPQCCWHKDQVEAHDCPNFRPGDEDLLYNRKERFLRRCVECPLFIQDLRSLDGDNDVLHLLFPFAIEELVQLRAGNRSLTSRLETLERQSAFLREVAQVLQSSLDRDEVIAMALTAVTAGKGFDLNRAVLLLVNRERQVLEGYLAIGPKDRAEAGRIWQEVETHDFTLREMARRLHEERLESEREKFRSLLEALQTSLNRTDHLFVRVLDQQESRLIRDLAAEPGIDPEQAQALGVNEMLLVPLISKQRRIGLLLADNLINQRMLTERDLQSLETFAPPVAYAIERAELNERLHHELERSTEANRRLKEQQLQILRMEKMALVGKITADVAHSIRNPLTIIGGFARNLAKKVASEDPQRPAIESIVREARRLEEALQEVLIYSEAQHPTLDDWDLNQILNGVYAGLQEDIAFCGARIELDLAPTLPLVRVDFKRTSQCLRSILHQLLNACNDGSSLRISTGQAPAEVRLLILADRLDPVRLPETGSITPDSVGHRTALGLSLCARVLEGQNATLDIQTLAEGEARVLIRIHQTKEDKDGPLADR